MTDLGVRPAADEGPPPVQAIERAVQERAKDLRLDMGVPAGRRMLRDLIDGEIEAWADEVRRGRRTQALTNAELVADRVWRNLAEHGPLTSLLTDPDVWEVEVNAPDQVFVKRHHGPSGYHHESFHDDDHVVRTLTKLLDESSASHRKLDPTEGLQDAQLDDGSRLHIVHADVARGGHVMVNIRRFTGVPFTRLDELVERDTLDATVAGFLAASVRAGASIVVAGAPGSGKTTLLSCCIGELDPSLRVVIAEEVFEVDAPLANVAQMQTRPARPDRPEIDLRRLVSGFLRWRLTWRSSARCATERRCRSSSPCPRASPASRPSMQVARARRSAASGSSPSSVTARSTCRTARSPRSSPKRSTSSSSASAARTARGSPRSSRSRT
jgi:pilus assembly protein CpaF